MHSFRLLPSARSVPIRERISYKSDVHSDCISLSLVANPRNCLFARLLILFLYGERQSLGILRQQKITEVGLEWEPVFRMTIIGSTSLKPSLAF